ncbi:MAG TPA: transcriptional regulator [Cytophagales bacterium]|nr:transcriptional regulator [Cytophagales bacterium]HAA23834.1 transcriptional regulator [Cytophagales bacterium]HAP59545.1 transcriptional regulator [Cytophagales bacterium]
MGATKSLNYTEDQLELSSLAKALAHPARIAILEHLINTKQCINSDLVDELGLAQPTISQHLTELKKANLLKGTVEGTRLNYCINSENWRLVEHYFSHFFAQHQDPPADNCC